MFLPPLPACSRSATKSQANRECGEPQRSGTLVTEHRQTTRRNQSDSPRPEPSVQRQLRSGAGTPVSDEKGGATQRARLEDSERASGADQQRQMTEHREVLAALGRSGPNEHAYIAPALWTSPAN